MIYQVKDSDGNVVAEFISSDEGPFTVVEKNDDAGGGPGSTDD